MTQYLPYSVLAIMNVAPDNAASCLSAISSARVCRSDGGVPGGPPAFTSRCGRFLTALGSGTPQARLLHPPRSAKVPPRRGVGPYLVSPILRRQEHRSPRFAGGAAAGEFPHTTTPGRPDPTDAGGCLAVPGACLTAPWQIMAADKRPTASSMDVYRAKAARRSLAAADIAADNGC